MIVLINSYKASGKWYDTFKVDVDDTIPCFETRRIQYAVERIAPQLREFNYTMDIDEPNDKWLKCLITNVRA